MKNKTVSLLLSFLFLLNACSAPKGEIAAYHLSAIIWDCRGGACVGIPEAGEGGTTGGEQGHGGETSGGDGKSKQGHGGEHRTNDGGGSSGGSMTKEQKQEYRRLTFERVNNEAMAVLEKVESEERIPPWLSETRGFLPEGVKITHLSEQEPLADPSDLVKSLVEVSNEVQPNSFAVMESLGLANPYFGRPDYKSEHRKELEEMHQRLDMSLASGPQQYDVKQAAYVILSKTDQAYLNADIELGDDLRETARVLVDVATDIIPFTAIPKDFYRAVVGVDVVTGAKLTGFERALAAGFFGLGVATGGSSNLLKTGLKQIIAITTVTEGEVRLTQAFLKVISKMPLSVEVLIKGKSNGVTLVGREMARVNEVAKSLNKEGIVVNILDERKFSREANAEWGRRINELGWLTPQEVRETIKFKENQEWIRTALKNGDTILDVGDFTDKPISEFYNMEKEEILRFIQEKAIK